MLQLLLHQSSAEALIVTAALAAGTGLNVHVHVDEIVVATELKLGLQAPLHPLSNSKRPMRTRKMKMLDVCEICAPPLGYLRLSLGGLLSSNPAPKLEDVNRAGGFRCREIS